MQKFVKPREGYKIVDPETLRVLPAEGASVDTSSYFWARMLRDGDIIIHLVDEVASATKAVAEAVTEIKNAVSK